VSWDDVDSVAFGVLRIPYTDLGLMNLRQLTLAVKAHQGVVKDQWEMVRTNAYFSLIAFNGSKKIKYDDVRLPTDPPKEIKLSKVTYFKKK